MNVKERLCLFIESQNLSTARFERLSKLSNGYVRSSHGKIGADKLDNILRAFPILNKDWLLYGNGEMLNPILHSQNNNTGGININGDNNNHNQVNNASSIDKALDEIAEQRKLVAASQDQINRLLTIIDKITDK